MHRLYNLVLIPIAYNRLVKFIKRQFEIAIVKFKSLRK